MKKLLIILILLLGINVYASVSPNAFCIGNTCLSGSGTYTVDGATGTMKLDLANKKLTLDNFSINIDYDDINSYETNSYEAYYSYIFTNIDDNFNVEIKGNNKITIDDINGFTKSYNYVRLFGFLGKGEKNASIYGATQDATLDFEIKQQTNKTYITLLYSETNNFYLEGFDSEVIGNYNVNFLSTNKNINVNDCVLDYYIKDEVAAHSQTYTKFFKGLGLNITNSEIDIKCEKNAKMIIAESNIITVNNSTIKDILENDYSSVVGAFDAMSDEEDYICKFKDSTINVKNTYGFIYFNASGEYVSDYTNSHEIIIEFDNTILDIDTRDYIYNFDYEEDRMDLMSVNVEPVPATITYKNYNNLNFIVDYYDTSNRDHIYNALYNDSIHYWYIESIKTVKSGNLKSNINNVSEYYELTEEDQNYLKTGNDITVSIINEELADLTESVINSVNTKKGKGTIIGYYNIEIVKEMDTNVVIHELKQEMTQEITIDDQYINDDPKVTRTYKVIRVHGDDVDALDATFDPNTKKLTFKSDKYSVFAVAYYDSNISNPKTGDNLTNNIIIAIISLIVLAIVLIVYKKKK